MNCNFYLTNSIDKIKKDTVLSEANNAISLCGAKGENVSFQLTIDCDEKLKYVNIVHSNPDGFAFEILREEYIDSADGYPDPLYPSSDCMILDEGRNTFLIKIKSQYNSEAEEYRIPFCVECDGECVFNFTVGLKLWNFALPKKANCTTAVGLYRDAIGKIYDIGDENEVQRLYVKYYDKLCEYRINAYDLPYDILDERADAYMDSDNVTSFRVPYFSDDETLKKYYAKLSKKQQWLDKAYIYALDEPTTVDSINGIKAIKERLDKYFPNARICTPFFTDIKYDENCDQIDAMCGNTNLWCPKTFLYNGTVLYNDEQRSKYKPFSERMAERRKLGDQVWWYVCWEPGNPYCNLFVNQEGLQHRLLFWQQYQCGVSGFLYWGANYWMGTEDPWNDMATVKNLSKDVYGDGSLLYNGDYAAVDGACASLRMEQILNGINDYDLLTLASEKRNRQITERIAKSRSLVYNKHLQREKIICEVYLWNRGLHREKRIRKTPS